MSVSVNGPALNASDFPIGGIIMWVTSSIPAGWLACQGQTIQKSAYPELVKVLTGSDSATSVDLPDMRGVSPAGTGYCSARGSSGNIKASPGLSNKDTMGSNTTSFSFTPSHTSNSQSKSIPLPAHTHRMLGRGSTIDSVQIGQRYGRTPSVNDITDSVTPGTHFYGGDFGVNEPSNIVFDLYTDVAGSSNNNITITFPGHSAISKSISVVHPVFGVTFIIKAKSV